MNKTPDIIAAGLEAGLITPPAPRPLSGHACYVLRTPEARRLNGQRIRRALARKRRAA